MKYPLVPVTLLLVAGIVAGEWVHPPPAILLFVSLAAALVCLLACILNAQRLAPFLLAATLFLTGWADMVCRTAVLSPNDLRRLLPSRPAEAVVTGVIRAPPAQRIFERDGRESWHNTVVVEADHITLDGVSRRAAGKVIVGTPGILPENFFIGQRVGVSGVIQPPREAFAQGLFSPRRYYQRQGIYFALSAASTNDWRALGDSAGIPLSARFSTWAQKTLALGLPGEDEPLRLIWTLVLDWKPALTPSVQEPFMRAGTFHIFAVDGLRIGMLATIGIGLLRALQFPRAIGGLIAIPAIWWYVGLTGWPASAVRAAIMTTVVIAGWAARRPGNLVNSLFAGAWIILIWNPQQLFQAGFQLSFLVVLCIGLLVPALEKAIGQSPYAALLPKAAEPRWWRFLAPVRKFAVAIFSVSLAAWLGSIPLTACYFHLFTPVSVPANCCVVPLASLALTSSLASLLIAPVCPAASILFNNSSWFWMKCIIVLSEWFSRWPGAWWNAAAPRPMAFAWFYMVLLTVCTGWIFRTRHKRRAIGFLAVAGILWAADWGIQTRISRIHVLSLRGAPAVFIPASRGNGDALLDCGDLISAQTVTGPFLQAQGVNRLENFCLTDARAENMGGAQIVLTNFFPRHLFAGAPRARSIVYRRFQAQAQQAGVRLTALSSGDVFGGWTVCHPGALDQFNQADDNAVVLRGGIAGQSLLLLSSLGRAGQDALVKGHPDLRADIVIAGLPARDDPLSEPLLDLLQPRTIILADSEFPASRRASAKLRERLAKRAMRILYCRDAGALTLVFRGGGLEIEDVNGNAPIEKRADNPAELIDR